MTYRYRCTRDGCRKRVSLRRLKEQYIRTPKCPGCNRDTLHRDTARQRESKKNRCWCNGYHFPHRQRSAPWCDYAVRMPSPEEMSQRQGRAA